MSRSRPSVGSTILNLLLESEAKKERKNRLLKKIENLKRFFLDKGRVGMGIGIGIFYSCTSDPKRSTKRIWLRPLFTTR